MKIFYFIFFIFHQLSYAQEHLPFTLGNHQNCPITSKQLALVVSEIESGKVIEDKEYALCLTAYLQFAEKNKNWESAIVLQNALANYQMFYEMNYEKVYEELKTFHKYISKVKNSQELAKYYIAYAEVTTFLQEYETSLEILNNAITSLEPKKEAILDRYAYMHLKAGENSSKVNDLIKSVTYFKEASELFLKQKDTVSYLWSQNGLSRLLGNNGLYDEADKARSPIFEWKHKTHEIDVVVMAHITAAIEAAMQVNAEKELYHVREALLLKDKMSTKLKNIIEILTHACATYVFARHDFLQESDKNLRELNKLMDGLGQNSFLDTYAVLARSQNAFAHKNYQTTKQNILEIIERVKASKEPENILSFKYLLAQAYQNSGDTKKALYYLEKYIKLKDSIQKSTSRKRLAYVQNQFETEKKDLEISKQKNYISLLAAENKLKSQWIILGGISLGSIFLALYLLRSKTFHKRRQKLQNKFYEDLLSSIENERKRIALDLHDSIGQNLLVIKNNFLLQDNKKDIPLVDDTINEVRELARNLHPHRFEKDGLFASLQNIIHTLHANTPIFFSLDLKIQKEREQAISKEKRLHVFRIIQEALNNVLKHSGAKACKLSIYETANHIHFKVQDNGHGFSTIVSEMSTDSLGMKTLRYRTEMIGGVININSTKGQGTVVHLKVQKK